MQTYLDRFEWKSNGWLFFPICLVGMGLCMAGVQAGSPANSGGSAFLIAGASPADSPPRITEFAGVPFGASRKVIIRKHGEPEQEKRVFPESRTDSGWALAYQGSFHEFSVDRVFYLHPRDGLLKGIMYVDAGENEECVGIFQTLRNYVKKKYPGLKPKQSRQKVSEKSFCKAMREGDASWGVQWTDPALNTVIVMLLPPESDYIQVHFETQAYRDWSKAVSEMGETGSPHS